MNNSQNCSQKPHQHSKGGQESTEDEMRAFQKQIQQRKDKVRMSFYEISSLLQKFKTDDLSIKCSFPSLKGQKPDFGEISSVEMKDSQNLCKSLDEPSRQENYFIPKKTHFILQSICGQIQQKINKYQKSLRQIEENISRNSKSPLRQRIEEKKFDKPCPHNNPLTNLALLDNSQSKNKQNVKAQQKRSPQKKFKRNSPKYRIHYYSSNAQEQQKSLSWFQKKNKQLQCLITNNRKMPEFMDKTSQYKWKIQKNCGLVSPNRGKRSPSPKIGKASGLIIQAVQTSRLSPTRTRASPNRLRSKSRSKVASPLRTLKTKRKGSPQHMRCR